MSKFQILMRFLVEVTRYAFIYMAVLGSLFVILSHPWVLIPAFISGFVFTFDKWTS